MQPKVISKLQNLPDVNVSPGAGVDGYSLTYDDASGKFVLTNVSGGGGSPDWGDIGGTLADQTDLNTALGGKISDGSSSPSNGELAVFTGSGNQVDNRSLIDAGIQPNHTGAADPDADYDVADGAAIGHLYYATGSDTLFYCSDASAGAAVWTAISGYTPGGTDVAVADGGTGASDAASARTNLGITPANIGAATSAQGATADAALPASGGALTGALRYATAAGLTASTTQTQGQQALTADINEISTCATTNDTVTLPTAAAGRCVVVINNGAETCQIFPASGDDLGQGVDTATTLAAGSSATFIAYDATNWHALS